MRIGLGCTMIEPAITHGQIDGVGFYTQFLLKELIKLNQDVTPYTFPPLKQREMQSSLPNGKTFKLPYTLATALSLFTSRAHGSIEHNFDVFHATDHLVPRFQNTPVVATLHDALILKHPDWFKPRFRHIKNFIRKQSMQWADHVITISHSMEKEAVEFWGIKENKLSVIYNGLSEHWFDPISAEQQQETMKRLGIPEQFILVAGTLQPKKNLPRIIHAYLALPQDLRDQHPLVIVGKDGWNTEESLAAIQKLTDAKAGYWLRYLPDMDLQTLFQAAHSYLHPSLHEGFGLTILQAFASGTPTLTSNITAMPEIAGDAALLVDPYSEEDIKNGMAKLLTQTSVREELVKKGLARAREFTWGKCAEQTLKVYQKAMK
jgi:glycosyltransferase involved in cell wall biosynthesis